MFPCLGWGFLDGSVAKESACNAQDAGGPCSIPGLGRSPWRRAWEPSPVSLPGEYQGQRRLAEYSPQGHKESHTGKVTEHACMFQLL